MSHDHVQRQAVFRGEIDTVVLYGLDRLARSIRDGINLLTDWISAGVRIVITTMQIDLSGALGQTVAALLLGLAQMEQEVLRERQAAGIAAWRERLKQEGKSHPGGRPPGTYKLNDRAQSSAGPLIERPRRLKPPACLWRVIAHAHLDPKRVAELRTRGLTDAEIGSALGVSIPTARKMLVAAGVERRAGPPRKLAG